MSLSIRDAVSQVRSLVRATAGDSNINDRVIAAELRSTVNMIVAQTLAKRKLWQSPNLFSFLPCIEMEKVPITECCEYSAERIVTKSKLSLPQIGEGIWGLAIQGVFGIDNMKKFKEVTPTRFANLLKLNLPSTNDYFWVLNNHLYTSNEDLKAANMFAFFTEDVPNELLYSPNCDCKQKPEISDLCANPLDKPFKFPLDRLDDIKNITYKKLLTTYFNIPQDKTSNNLDEQAKP